MRSLAVAVVLLVVPEGVAVPKTVPPRRIMRGGGGGDDEEDEMCAGCSTGCCGW